MTIEKIQDPEHLLAVIDELSARWHRAKHAQVGKIDPHFNAGRAEGYVQAVQLLMGIERPQALDLIREIARRNHV